MTGPVMSSADALNLLQAAVNDLKRRRLDQDLPNDPALDCAMMKVKIEVMGAQVYRDTIEQKLHELGERWARR